MPVPLPHRRPPERLLNRHQRGEEAACQPVHPGRRQQHGSDGCSLPNAGGLNGHLLLPLRFRRVRDLHGGPLHARRLQRYVHRRGERRQIHLHTQVSARAHGVGGRQDRRGKVAHHQPLLPLLDGCRGCQRAAASPDLLVRRWRGASDHFRRRASHDRRVGAGERPGRLRDPAEPKQSRAGPGGQRRRQDDLRHSGGRSSQPRERPRGYHTHPNCGRDQRSTLEPASIGSPIAAASTSSPAVTDATATTVALAAAATAATVAAFLAALAAADADIFSDHLLQRVLSRRSSLEPQLLR